MGGDERKTKAALIDELDALRAQVGHPLDVDAARDALAALDAAVTDVEGTNIGRYPLKLPVHDRWKRDLRTAHDRLKGILA